MKMPSGKNIKTFLRCTLLSGAILAALSSSASCAQIHKTTLNNGMVVILKETNISDITACELLVKAGTHAETEDTAGYTRLLQNVLAEGQGSRAREKMESQLAVTGGYLNLDSTSDFAEFTTQAATENINDSLDTMEKLVFHPAFTQKELDGLKHDFLESIQKRGAEAFDTAYDIFLEDYYASHPYSKSELGTQKSIENASLETVMNFYNTYYVPNNMVMSCAGNFNTKDMEKRIEERFGKYSSRPLPENTVQPYNETEALEQEKEEAREMNIKAVLLFFGFQAPGVNSEDYPALRVINSYLGARGGPAELAAVLHDRLNVAEDVWSFYPLREDTSHFVCAAITYPHLLDKAKSALLFEIAKLKYAGIDGEKLESIKTYLTGEFLMDHEHVKQQAFYLAFFELLGPGYEYDDEYVEKIKNITSDDVERAAQRYFNNFITVVLNPKNMPSDYDAEDDGPF